MALLKTESAAKRAVPYVERWALAVSIGVATVLLVWTLYRG